MEFSARIAILNGRRRETENRKSTENATNKLKRTFSKLEFSLQTYMAPFAAIFIDPDDPENAMYNNFRVFGTILLYFMGMVQSIII